MASLLIIGDCTTFSRRGFNKEQFLLLFHKKTLCSASLMYDAEANHHAVGSKQIFLRGLGPVGTGESNLSLATLVVVPLGE